MKPFLQDTVQVYVFCVGVIISSQFYGVKCLSMRFVGPQGM